MDRSDRRPGYMLPLRSNGYCRLGYHRRQTSRVGSVVVLRHEVDIYWTWFPVAVGVCYKTETQRGIKK